MDAIGQDFDDLDSAPPDVKLNRSDCIEGNSTVTSSSTLTSTDLYRSPSWRWEAAMREKDNPGGLSDRHDPDIRVVVRSIQHDGFEAFIARGDEFSRLIFLKTYPELQVKRSELESRILAGQSPKTISHDMELPLGLIDRYERWFFDVRSQLKNTEYIFRRVIDITTPFDLIISMEKRWKYFGYLGKQPALRCIMQWRPVEDQPGSREEAARWLDDFTVCGILSRLASLAADPTASINAQRQQLRYFMTFSQKPGQARPHLLESPDRTPSMAEPTTTKRRGKGSRGRR
jgi:hypothetical protein